jgi:G3E family GTPase
MARHGSRPMADETPHAVPFTILTGWLGAGKTTTLNRMLSAPHGRRIAVLVNELGRIAIDTRLIVGRGGDVLELAGGCVCCKVDTKNDLWDGIAEVVQRTQPEQVVLETTGIAQPAAIIDGLARVPEAVRARILPAGIVCVVDGEAGAGQLERRDEAREQVIAADRILLSKLDVAPAAAAAAVHARLRALNPTAERASFPRDDDGGMAMTAWILEARPLQGGAATAHDHHDHDHGGHHHPGQLAAAIFTDPAPLLAEQLLELVASLGDRLVRAKGWVHLAGEPRRGFLERAGLRTELRLGEPWGETPPRTELVLIGDDLDEPTVRRALWACRAAA